MIWGELLCKYYVLVLHSDYELVNVHPIHFDPKL